MTLTVAAGTVIVAFMALLGATIIWGMWSGKINLNRLISEPTGNASLSRLQLLIFTFVISLSLFLITVGGKNAPAFPTSIPPEILVLLGISASSYLVSKGIQFASPAGVATPTLIVTPTTAGPLTEGSNTQFTVSILNAPAGTQLPPITWALDAPAEGKLAPSPNGATYTAPTPLPAGGLKGRIRAKADGFQDGTAVIS